MSDTPIKINGRYILMCCIAVCFSFFFHELSHWIAGEALGQQMVLTLNSVYPLQGVYTGKYDYEMVSAAGPLFTIVQAIVCFVLMQRKQRVWVYPFLFTTFYMRLQATIISFFNLNDEARISKTLGIGTFTLPLVVTGFLFYLVLRTSRRYRFSTKFNLLTLALIIAFSSVIILADQRYHIRIL